MMKIKLLLIFLLAITINGFSQLNIDLYINLVSMKETQTTIPLRPVSGQGKEITIPATLFWYNKDGKLKLELKGGGAEEMFVYAFPAKQEYKKLMKNTKEIWFDKKMIKKFLKKKMVEGCVDNNMLAGATLDENDNLIKALELRDPESRMTWFFNKNGENCKIPMTLYVASRENVNPKSTRSRKIEYPTKFTLNIFFKEICDAPELNKVVDYLDAEMLKLLHQKNEVLAALDSVYDLPCAKIKELKQKTVGKEEKFTGTKDQQYNDCENLKQSINDYNETLEARNNAIYFYNSKLDERKQKCATTPTTTTGGGTENCRTLYQINEKLTELLLDVKNVKQSNIASFQQKYENIKGTVGTEYKSCKKEYNTFLDLCSRIEKRLK